MIQNGQYVQMRNAAFLDWARESSLPGIKSQMFSDVFEYVLSKQNASGSFHDQGTPWEIVQTAVVLNALAALKFKPEDCWDFYDKQNLRVQGGVKQALDFLIAKLGNSSQVVVGEDIWDACQVLLAVAVFGRRAEGSTRANDINLKWDEHYRLVESSGLSNRWCGPAYLAAMMEVVHCYQAQLSQTCRITNMFQKLKTLEQKETTLTGCFPAVKSDPNTNRWNTALVLRTLGRLGPEFQDSNLIERVVIWLLKELQQDDAWQDDPREEPMFRARCLDGLFAVITLVSSTLQQNIQAALANNGRRLSELKASNIGDLKAHTAVCEYLGNLTWPLPAGLAIDIAHDVRTPETVDLRPNGFRLVWLSDLHAAHVGDETPFAMNLVKQFIRGFMYVRGTPMAQNFQEQNLVRILGHVEDLKPDHILVTGDLTNFAQEDQFKSVREKFLSTQKGIKGSATQLDPSFWTILPGNHDITEQRRANGKIRHNLGMFFHYFAEAYGGRLTNYDNAFPLSRGLGKKNGGLGLRLHCLDSNVEWPVWAVGVNARGQIDKAQFDRFASNLSTPGENEVVILALHHHPIVVPEMISDAEDYFLSLDEAVGRRLVALCATNNVSAILHGHFHKFSMWSGLVPQKTRRMQIIGSPAGTVDIPNTNQEFLELREAKLNSQSGFALYSHRYEQTEWVQVYQGFID